MLRSPTAPRFARNGTASSTPLLLATTPAGDLANTPAGDLAKPTGAVAMSRPEREVIELIADGLSNKEIARRLHLATDTVKSHLCSILKKLVLHRAT